MELYHRAQELMSEHLLGRMRPVFLVTNLLLYLFLFLVIIVYADTNEDQTEVFPPPPPNYILSRWLASITCKQRHNILSSSINFVELTHRKGFSLRPGRLLILGQLHGRCSRQVPLHILPLRQQIVLLLLVLGINGCIHESH